MQKTEVAVKEAFGSLKPNDSLSFEKVAELILEVRKKMEGETDAERKAQNWLSFLLPPPGDEELVLRESGVSSEQSPASSPPVSDAYAISPTLRRLLDETSDLVDSPTFSQVLTGLLDAAFTLLIDGKVASQAYKITTGPFPPLEEPRVIELSGDDAASSSDVDKQKSVKLATVLAVFTRQAHAIGSGGNLAETPESDFPQIPGLPQPPPKEPNEYLAAIEHVSDLQAFAAVVYSSNFEYEAVDVGAATDSFVPQPPSQPVVELQQSDDAPSDMENAWKRALAKEDGQDT